MPNLDTPPATLARIGRAVSRRLREPRFWLATLIAGALYLGVLLPTLMLVVTGLGRMDESREPWLWTGVVLATALAGLAAALLARRIAFWELSVAVLGSGVLLLLHGRLDLLRPLGLSAYPTGTLLTAIASRGPGALYFGNQWDRLLLLGLLVSLVVGLFVSSCAHLVRGAGLRLRDGFEAWIGLRYLLARRRAGFVSSTALVSVLGVGLGVASLIAVTGVMSGYQQDVTDRILDSNAHLVVQKYGIDFSEHPETIALARSLPQVRGAAPFVFNEAMLSTNHGLSGIMLKGIDARRAHEVTNIARQLRDGASLLSLLPGEGAGAQALPGLLIGAELQRELGLQVGEVVALTTPVGMARMRGTAPRRMSFRVGGVFSSGIFEFDQKLVYADVAAAQEFMGLGATVTGIELRVAEPARVAEVSRAILGKLKGYPYRTLDWREMNAGIFTALRIQKLAMFIVLTFIIVVAAFNIASTLFMVVVEKAPEIALLKAVGARDESVMKTFVLVGWMIGLVGTLGGALAGLAVAGLLAQARFQIAAEVYLVDRLSVRIEPLEVLVTAAAALIISHLATLYPSLQAARVSPAEGLRAQ